MMMSMLMEVYPFKRGWKIPPTKTKLVKFTAGKILCFTQSAENLQLYNRWFQLTVSSRKIRKSSHFWPEKWLDVPRDPVDHMALRKPETARPELQIRSHR